MCVCACVRVCAPVCIVTQKCRSITPHPGIAHARVCRGKDHISARAYAVAKAFSARARGGEHLPSRRRTGVAHPTTHERHRRESDAYYELKTACLAHFVRQHARHTQADEAYMSTDAEAKTPKTAQRHWTLIAQCAQRHTFSQRRIEPCSLSLSLPSPNRAAAALLRGCFDRRCGSALQRPGSRGGCAIYPQSYLTLQGTRVSVDRPRCGAPNF